MLKEWLFFGCHRVAGHYLHRRHMSTVSTLPERKLVAFDGMLAPKCGAHPNDPYVATVTRLEGWGCTALSFWDYTVDARIGSNCIFFAPSLTITPEDLLKEAALNFPTIWHRFPEIVLLQTILNKE
jgi:hypothetical protein